MLHRNPATFTLKIGLKQESLGLRSFFDGKTFNHFRIVAHEADLKSVGSRGNIFESKLSVEIRKNLLIDLNQSHGGTGQCFCILSIQYLTRIRAFGLFSFILLTQISRAHRETEKKESAYNYEFFHEPKVGPYFMQFFKPVLSMIEFY